jgi:hypothetical protein
MKTQLASKRNSGLLIVTEECDLGYQGGECSNYGLQNSYSVNIFADTLQR